MSLENPEAFHHNSFHWKLGRQWAVRKGSWKLLGNPTDPAEKYPLRGKEDELFLVNLEEDLSEKNNLAKKYPEKVEELKELYLDWEFGGESDIPKKLPPLKNLATGAQITGTSPNANYSKNGLSCLINNKRGSGNIRDGEWASFKKEDFSAEITLHSPIKAKTISVRCLQDLGSWIFLPSEIEMWVTTDAGNEIYLGKLMRPKKFQEKDYTVQVFSIKAEKSIRSLKIKIINQGICPDWHPGKGGDAWLFIDEIVVE